MHKENDFVDFDRERLSRRCFIEGPPMALGDVNGDGLDDAFLGSQGPGGALLLQQQTDVSLAAMRRCSRKIRF